jgi:predicted phage-related endonuclease
MSEIVKIRKPEHGSEAWHEKRRRYKGKPIFSASEIAALMGASQYDSPASTIAKKLAPIKVTRGNAAMRRGTYLERGIIDYARDDRFPELTVPKFMYLRLPVVATLDSHVLTALGDVERVVEVKTTVTTSIDDPLPLDYFWQVQAQMFSTNAQEATVVCLDRRMKIGYWDVKRNEDAIGAMVQTVESAIELVKEGRIPDSWDMKSDDINAMFTDLSPVPVELDEGGYTTIREWAASKYNLKDAQDQEAKHRDRVANLLREHEAASFNGVTLVTYKRHTTKRFNSEAFRNEHPDLATKYQIETEQRTLLNKMRDY